MTTPHRQCQLPTLSCPAHVAIISTSKEGMGEAGLATLMAAVGLATLIIKDPILIQSTRLNYGS
jgi:hypothetical protein